MICLQSSGVSSSYHCDGLFPEKEPFLPFLGGGGGE